MPTPSENYEIYADYEETGSVDRCRKFITACKRIIGLASRASKTGQGAGAMHEFDVPMIREELSYARRWLSRALASDPNSDCPGVIDVDFTEFNGRQ